MRPRILVAALLIATSGCSKPVPPVPVPVPVPETKTYRLIGVVREVDAKSGVVEIAHEDIPGFMNAMTMAFTPKDKSSLEEMGVGDRVEGPLVVTREQGKVKDYNLLSLEVTEPAPRTISFGTGGVSVTTKPAVLTVGDRVPDFAMTTQEGKPLRLSDLRGKVVVVTFIYTRCPLPDFCPAVDKKFRELANAIGSIKSRAEGVNLLSISFDPEHDTVETLRKHAETQGAKPPLWTFAVAAHDELRKAGPRLGLIYGPMPNEIRHNMVVAVIGADGKLVRLDSGKAGMSWTAADLLKTIVSTIGK